MKTCKIENCNNNIWSNGLCKNHIPRKRIYSKVPSKEEMSKIFDDVLEMRAFFLSIWNKRKHESEISGTYLGREPLTVFFHHILEKEKHEEAKLNEENIILLTLDEHTNVGNDIYRYPEINKRREYLKIKYNL